VPVGTWRSSAGFGVWRCKQNPPSPPTMQRPLRLAALKPRDDTTCASASPSSMKPESCFISREWTMRGATPATWPFARRKHPRRSVFRQASSRLSPRNGRCRISSPCAAECRFSMMENVRGRLGYPARSRKSTRPLQRQGRYVVARFTQFARTLCKDMNFVIRFGRIGCGGGNHGCEGHFGKEVCCAAER
jgi:hypothetical protein